MKLTAQMFKDAYHPPAVVNVVHDAACVWVDVEDDQPAFFGLIFEISHPEIPDKKFLQLFRLSPDVTALVADELQIHLDNM